MLKKNLNYLIVISMIVFSLMGCRKGDDVSVGGPTTRSYYYVSGSGGMCFDGVLEEDWDEVEAEGLTRYSGSCPRDSLNGLVCNNTCSDADGSKYNSILTAFYYGSYYTTATDCPGDIGGTYHPSCNWE